MFYIYDVLLIMLIMLIRKIAQGWQGGNQAEFSYISI